MTTFPGLDDSDFTWYVKLNDQTLNKNTKKNREITKERSRMKMLNEKKQEVWKVPLAYTSTIKLKELSFAAHKCALSCFNQKKVKIPIFEVGSDEELLFTMRAFHNMVVGFNFMATLNHNLWEYSFFWWNQEATRDTLREIQLDPDINGGPQHGRATLESRGVSEHPPNPGIIR